MLDVEPGKFSWLLFQGQEPEMIHYYKILESYARFTVRAIQVLAPFQRRHMVVYRATRNG